MTSLNHEKLIRFIDFRSWLKPLKVLKEKLVEKGGDLGFKWGEEPNFGGQPQQPKPSLLSPTPDLLTVIVLVLGQ